MSEMTAEQAAALRAPFPPEQIGQLPRAGITLAYVGHAAVCDRLLRVDPEWSWTPMGVDEHGLPLITRGPTDAALWIRLTVCGVTRLGVGLVPLKAFELEKQLISDALRNAAMRFGVALDLWAKEPLAPAVAPFDPAVDADTSVIDTLKKRIDHLDDTTRLTFTGWKNDQGFPWPWPVVACEQMHTELDRLETVAGAPTGASTATPGGFASSPGVVAGVGADADGHSPVESASPALDFEDAF